MPEPQSSHEIDAAPPGTNGWPPAYRIASINEQQMLGRTGTRSVRTLAGVLVAVVVGAVVAVAGWRLMSSPSSPPSSSAPLTAAASGAANATGQPSQIGTLLETIALQQTDLHNGYRMHLVGHGDQVAGQVTLDNCGYRFTTEAHRVARREYEIVDPAGHFAGAGNEVVAYDNPANAALALDQWHHSVLTCPRHAVVAVSAGGHRVLERVTRDEVDSPALPEAHNLVTVESATAPRLGTMYMIVVLQVRGNILDAVFGAQHRSPTDSDIRGMLLIATATGLHLTQAA